MAQFGSMGTISAGIALDLQKFFEDAKKIQVTVTQIDETVTKKTKTMEETISESMARVTKAMQAIGSKREVFGETFDEGAAKAGALKKELIGLLDAGVEPTNKAVQDLAKQLKTLEDQMQAEAQAAKNQAQQNNTAAESLEKTATAAAKAEAKTRDLGAMMQQAGQMMSLAFTLPVVGAGVMAGRTESAFDDAMANVWTIVDTSREGLKEFADQIEGMTRDIPRDAVDLANGLYQVISAAVPAGDAMGVLEEAAKGAAAGMTDTYTSVDALTTVMNAYGMSAEQAGYITDIMFRTVERGKVTYEQLASTLGIVISNAASARVPFTEVAGAIATMTRNGLSAEMSATSLAYAIRSLVAPQERALQAADRYGIKIGEVELAEKGLVGMMRELYQATGGSQAKLTQLVGSIEGARAAVILGKGAAADFANDVSIMGDAAGATEKAFSKLMTTESAQLKLFKNEWDIAVRSWAKEAMPTLIELAQTLKIAARAFGELPGGVKQATIGFGAMVAAVGPLTYAIGSAMKIIQALKPVLGYGGGLVGWLGAAAVAVVYLYKVFKDLYDPVKQVEAKLSEVNKRLSAYKDLAADYGSQASRLNSLITAYDRLTASSERSAAQQKQLANAIREIGQLAPDSVIKWDKLGNAIEVNADKARATIVNMLNLQKKYLDAQSDVEVTRKRILELQIGRQKDSVRAQNTDLAKATGTERSLANRNADIIAIWDKYTKDVEKTLTAKYGDPTKQRSSAQNQKIAAEGDKLRDAVLKTMLKMDGIPKDIKDAINTLLGAPKGANKSALRDMVEGLILTYMKETKTELAEARSDKQRLTAATADVNAQIDKSQADINLINSEIESIKQQTDVLNNKIEQVQDKGFFVEQPKPEEKRVDPKVVEDTSRKTDLEKAIEKVKQEFEQDATAYAKLQRFNREITDALMAKGTDEDKRVAEGLEAELREAWAKQIVDEVKKIAEADPMKAMSELQRIMQGSFDVGKEPQAARGLQVLTEAFNGLAKARNEAIEKMKQNTNVDGLDGLTKQILGFKAERDTYAKQTGDTAGANEYFATASSRAVESALQSIGETSDMSAEAIDKAIEKVKELDTVVRDVFAGEDKEDQLTGYTDQIENVWTALAERLAAIGDKETADSLADLQDRLADAADFEGRIEDAEKLRLEADLNRKRKQGWEEIDLEAYKVEQIAVINGNAAKRQADTEEALYALHKTLGKVTAAEQLKHELSLASATKAGLADRYQALESFYESVKDLSEDAKDAQVKDMKAALTEALKSYSAQGEAAADIVEAIKAALAWLADPSNYAKPEKKDKEEEEKPTWGGYLGEQLGGAFSDYGNALSAISQGYQMTKDLFAAIVASGSKISGIAGAFTGIGSAVGGMLAGLIMLIASSRQFRVLSELIAPTFQTIADSVGAILEPIIPILVSIFRWVANIFKSVSGFFRWIGDAVAWVWNGIANFLNTILGWIPGFHVNTTQDIAKDNPEIQSALDESASGGNTQISEITGETRDLLIETLRPLVNLDSLPILFSSLETSIIEMKEALLAYLGQEVGGQRAATAAANYWQIENVYVNMPADSEGGAGMMQSLLTILAKNAKNVLKGSGA